MANMMSPGMLSRMTPEGRIANSYESLYFGAVSGDPEADDIVRKEMARRFETDDVTLADRPDEKTLRQMMVGTYMASTEALQASPVDVAQQFRIEQAFDRFASEHAAFYERSFRGFERVHPEGFPVDHLAEYARYAREQRDPFAEQLENDTVDVPSFGYGSPVDIPPVTKRAFGEPGAEHASPVRDAAYAEYMATRPDNGSGFTAGDDYGFDEPVERDEVEDDGPSL